MKPELSIVIVNYNGGAHLQACLQSLHAEPPALEHETLVVDNASADGSVDEVSAFGGVRLLRLPENVGFSRGNNAGIRATSGELVLLLNNDTIVPGGAIDRLVRRLREKPEAAVAGPRLVDENGRPELSFGRMITPLSELRQKAIERLRDRGFVPAVRWVERATGREQYVDWVSGACLLVWRRAAEEAGLLDERFFLYTEDVDFCATIRSRGRKVLFTPSAEIVHLRGKSRATAAQGANHFYRRSQIAFYEKHHPRLAPLLRLYLGLKGALPAEESARGPGHR